MKINDLKVSLSNSKESSKMMIQLMKQKRDGKIPGICGRMGDLGIIDAKYDVAISTACGSLNSILVETVEVGQKCIELLKRDNLGRANFTCMDKIPKFDLSKISTPQNAPRLFDLVQCDSNYKMAFYQALGDTLVATDMTQANQIAYGATRYKVVTLDGQVIDKSGTMSGGGKTVSKGGMSSKKDEDATPEMLQELTELLKIANNSLCHDDLNEAEICIRQDTSRLEECKRQHGKITMDIDSLRDEISDAEKSLELAR